MLYFILQREKWQDTSCQEGVMALYGTAYHPELVLQKAIAYRM